jgi:hypothetical protein
MTCPIQMAGQEAKKKRRRETAAWLSAEVRAAHTPSELPCWQHGSVASWDAASRKVGMHHRRDRCSMAESSADIGRIIGAGQAMVQQTPR